VGYYQVVYTSNDTCAFAPQVGVDLSFCGAHALLETAAEMQLYPVPSKGLVFLQSNQSNELSKIAIFDILGNIVYFEQTNLAANVPWAMPLDFLAAGNYWLKVEDAQASRTFKLVIQP
jgi:hypothetical protein